MNTSQDYGIKQQPDGTYTYDGCEYADLGVVVLEGLFGFCGCGFPHDATIFILETLRMIEAIHDGTFEKYKAEQQRLCDSDGNAMFIFYVLDRMELTEHGGSVPGWLSQKGKDVLAMLEEWNK